MPKFPVIVRYYVPAYARIQVDADTQVEAETRVTHGIATDGFSCSLLDNVEFTADWQATSELSVVNSAPGGLLDSDPRADA